MKGRQPAFREETCMIRHCVFVRYRPTVTEVERRAIVADLAALRHRLKGFRRFDSGPNVNPEGLGHGFDVGFVIDFDDVAARDAYLVDPEHQAIGARIGVAAAGGAEGVFVFDFELAE
jgi:hypothetical protein